MFQVDWPERGTFDLQTIYQVKNAVFRKPGHPDQVPDIVTWQNLVEDPPPWLKAFLPPPLRTSTQVFTLRDGEEWKPRPGVTP